MPIVALAGKGILACGFAVVAGLALTFGGRRLFRIALGILGLAVGAVVGARVAGGAESTIRILAIGGGAVICGTALMLLWRVGLFVLGAGFGAAALTSAYRPLTGDKPEPVMLVMSAVLGGMISLALRNLILVLGTAFVGALSVTLGIGGVTGDYDPGPFWTALREGARAAYERDTVTEFFSTHPSYFWLFLGLAVAGTVVQLLTAPKDRDRE